MFYVTKDVRRALEAELWVPALFTALAGIDICSALSSDNGETSGAQYKRWVENRASDIGLSAEDVYKLRCGMLHQGKYQGKTYDRIVFSLPVPNNIVLHMNTFGETYNLDLRRFCESICRAIDHWWQQNETDEVVSRNYSETVQFRPDGAQYGFSGFPVLA
ncbi:hypothetical protein [Leucobacter sp. G161]|uniref:hypothetical protein n=1 Tax=Leucobacter sp. G161 TaxID=663704 RepID=UPI00073BD0D6|nr:hypothetical protein [Leucobacter sp. G161]KUF07174.1 hypothetical protein AUL38_02485 [Leucobacter sp. G161]